MKDEKSTELETPTPLTDRLLCPSPFPSRFSWHHSRFTIFLSVPLRHLLHRWVWQVGEPAAGSARGHGAAVGESGQGWNCLLAACQNVCHCRCEPNRGTLQQRQNCFWKPEVSDGFIIYWTLASEICVNARALALCWRILIFRMGSALLSRFDVVFILLDIPDESHDRHLSEHVMANRTGRGGASSAVVTRTDPELETSVLLDRSDMPLSERLQVKKKPNKKKNQT